MDHNIHGYTTCKIPLKMGGTVCPSSWRLVIKCLDTWFCDEIPDSVFVNIYMCVLHVQHPFKCNY